MLFIARLALVLLAALPFALGGCAGLVVRGTLPEGARVVSLGPSDEGTPFALDPSGKRLAVVRGHLAIVELSTGAETRVRGRPLALAWSPDGARLAASFPAAEGSTLELLDARGAVLASAPVRGQLTSLAWASPAEVLGATVHLQNFSFGAGREETLVRWSGEGAPRLELLGATTLMRATLQRHGALLGRAPVLAIAPQGDVVAYTRIHDPPRFSPFVAIEVRHLDGTTAREVGRTSLGAASPAWAPDGDSLWFSGGAGLVRQACWETRELGGLATPGRTLAVSPRGTWVFADGRVLRGAEEVVAFAPDAEGAFTAAGLVLRTKGALVLLDSFAESPAPPVAEPERARVLELRKSRASSAAR